MTIKSSIEEKLIVICIRFLERILLGVPAESLSAEEHDGLLSMLWDNKAFRNYVKDRNGKLVYALAGMVGSEPEPRDKSRLLMGQRVENLVLANKAKICAERRDKAMALKKASKA